jgi:DMATS type aromatic prenyltransferase
MLGGEIRLDGVAQTRAYFCPGPRAKLMGVSPIVLLTSCLDELGLSQPWERVTKFIGSCPLSHHVSDPFFLAVGTAPANNNSAKVYFRTQASSLTDLLEYMMMTMHGGPRLTSTPDALQAIASFRRLWSLLFPGVKDDQPLYSLRPDQPSSGFLVYYEMKLGSVTPQAKVYINVKHFCPDDAHVARAIATYYDELGHSTFAQAYLIALQSL